MLCASGGAAIPDKIDVEQAAKATKQVRGKLFMFTSGFVMIRHATRPP